MERLSRACGHELWIKRDDHTGLELSGNKVRKLEFVLREALDTGCDTLVTCGGIQSNHARATAAAAARLGLDCVLVLDAGPDPAPQGNYLLDQWLGAQVRLIRPDQVPARAELMAGVCAELAARGRKRYILPLGASKGLGVLGYAAAVEELCEQEAALGFRFGAVVCPVGSGGTLAGLALGRLRCGHTGEVCGVPVAEDAGFFRPLVRALMAEAAGLLGEAGDLAAAEPRYLDGYAGRGYALSSPAELDTLGRVARTEGVLLDPVYTGKAMHGLLAEIGKGGFPGAVCGVPVAEDAAYFRPIVAGLLGAATALLGEPDPAAADLRFLDGYAGRGYGLSRPEELDTLRRVARTEGVLLDPVYTGKAMHGLLAEIGQGTFRGTGPILFLHTGGLFGNFQFLAPPVSPPR